MLDDQEPGGNLVLAASDEERLLTPSDLPPGVTVTSADDFAARARVLTDDRAPADQLLTPRP